MNTRTAAGRAAGSASTITVRRTGAQTVRRRRLSDLPGGILATTAVIVLVALWEAIVRIFSISTIVLPAPSRIAEALWGGIASGTLLHHTWVTLQEILAGFGIAVVLGITVAIIVSSSRLAEKTFMPIIVVLQTVPKVALAPLFLVWFGFGIESKILTTALIAFFPILVNSSLGFNSTSTDQIAMMRSFGASRRQILTKLRFPTAVPSIVEIGRAHV